MEKELFEQREKILLDLMRDQAYVPMKAKEIAAVLNIPKSQRGELKEVLDALVSQGKASISKKGRYGRPEHCAGSTPEAAGALDL